jgi:membrane fusion protein (multidrug efflux system)
MTNTPSGPPTALASAPGLSIWRRAPLRAAVVATLAVAAAFVGWAWINADRPEVSTDNAYVRADKTLVSPKVRGMIAEVLVAENQPVKAGDPLVRIDPAEYDARLEAAQGDLMAAEAAARTARSGLARLDAEAAAAGKTVDAAKALAGPALADPKIRDAFAAAQAQALVVARSRAEFQAKLAEAQAAAFRARTALNWARLEKDETLVRAPVAGVAADIGAEPGALVQPGVRLLTIVRPSTLYVTANFKETQTTRMLAGQIAKVRVDALPGRIFTGKVASIAPASGSEFALIPFEPGAGNFTKIVQRIPVRVALDPGQKDLPRLRSGLSAVVTVKVEAGS